jgi:hypothetical protein
MVTRSLCCQLLDLSNDLFQCARELGRLVGVEFHNEPAASLERNPHDDATSLLGDFHRAVTRPRFHCSHRASSSCSDLATCRLNYSVPPVGGRLGSIGWDGSNHRQVDDCGPAGAVAVELVRPDRRWRKAAEHMIINQTDRLHRRVRRGRADKTEAKPFELSGHSD